MRDWYLNPILEQLFGRGSYAVVALLGCLLLAAWVVGVLFIRVTGRRRLVLAGLRLLVIALLIVSMLRPTRVITDVKPQPVTFVVLVDRSRSMTVKDAFGGRTRWEALTKSLDDASPALARLVKNRNCEVRAYQFDADAQTVEFKEGRIALDKVPRGDQSAYGVSLHDVLRRETGKRLIGLLLMGDGALNTTGTSAALPQAAARTLAQWQAPLFVVPFGQRLGSGLTADVEVEAMPDDIKVFVKNEITVNGTVRIWGYANREIPVQLYFEQEPGKPKLVDGTALRATRDGEQLHYELHYAPQQPGEYRITVRVPPQPGEKTIDNNELSTYVTVLQGGLRVLYLEGEARPEQRFLRAALSSSSDIDVTLKWVRSTDRRQWPLQTLDGVPVTDLFKPGKFDVYILGDLDSDCFSKEDWGRLKETVTRGAGLIMLGGWHSFWPGGYHDTPLVDILPVAYDAQVESSMRQKFESFVPPDAHLEGQQIMRPSEPLGARHYIMQLEPGRANLPAWTLLPPLDGANRFRGARQGAVVLAENEAHDPLLIASQVGGRVLAFAGDSTWRWVMHGQGDAHRRFWRQVVLWLARKDEVTKGNVWIDLESRRYMPGVPVRFTAGARTAEGTAIGDATFTASLLYADGTRLPLMPRRRGDEVEAEITDKLPPGQYMIEVTAARTAGAIGIARARFLVYEKDLEMTNSTADPALLASLAAATSPYGGKTVMPEGLSALCDELASKPVTFDVTVRVPITYWDQWWYFLLLVGLMSVEWFLRKKWRLV